MDLQAGMIFTRCHTKLTIEFEIYFTFVAFDLAVNFEFILK